MRTTALLSLILLPVLVACDGDSKDSGAPSTSEDGLVDADGDGVTADFDCDDTDASISPSAEESCDGVDNDCDGEVDEGVQSTFYPDVDGDGYGVSDEATEACAAPAGAVSQAGDCDDDDASVNPGAIEVCDPAGIDEDCSGLSNDEDPRLDTSSGERWYVDADGDGFGNADDEGFRACADPSTEVLAFVRENTDCDDSEATVNPRGVEVCDANDVDEDCSGLADDDDDSVHPDGRTLFYADDDSDGYGDPLTAMPLCDAPENRVADDTDCDDDAADVNPGATEVCDDADVDEDCSGAADDADPGLDTTTASTWFLDVDGDGYGDLSDSGTAACEDPSTGLLPYVADSTDCNDRDAAVNPGATEVCDDADVDEDCSGASDDDDAGLDLSTATTWYADADLDGFGDETDSGTVACEDPSGATTYVDEATDCDDDDLTVYPGAESLCGDAVVNDCELEQDDEEDICRWYATYDIDHADAVLSSDNSQAGSLPTTGDFDGDGVIEVVFGALWTEDATAEFYSGGIGIVEGDQHGDVDLETDGLWLEGDSLDMAGSAVAGVGDLDGDGYDDLLVGGTLGYTTGAEAGAAWLLHGPLTSGSLSTLATATWTGAAEDDGLGSLAAAAGDVDNDGIIDILVGAAGEDENGNSSGTIYLLSGSVSASGGVSTAATAIIYGESTWDVLGYQGSAAALGDVDGDGYGDFAIAAPYADDGDDESGTVYIFHGPVSGTLSADDAATRIIGTDSDTYLGVSVVGGFDADGDGTDDMAVGEVRSNGGGSDGGAAYIVTDLSAGDSAVTDVAWLSVYGEAGDAAGGSVDVADQDGDGTYDLLLGSSYTAHKGSSGLGMTASSESAQAWLLLGPGSGSISVTAADVSFSSDSDGEYFGAKVAFLGDLGGDGAEDVGIVDPSNYNRDQAELYIFAGGGY